MKLVIFGATGRTGQQLVKLGLETGHQITAAVRRPEAITLKHERLSVIHCDVLKYEDVQAAVAGHEAVLSALGVVTHEPTTVYSAGVSHMLRAMAESRVRRILCVSATGLDPGPLLQRLIAKPLLWRLFKDGYTDMARMEAIIRLNDLDWSIVRPPRLTNGPRTGKYQEKINNHLTHGAFLSRADLADYMLAHLCDPRTYRALIEVAY